MRGCEAGTDARGEAGTHIHMFGMPHYRRANQATAGEEMMDCRMYTQRIRGLFYWGKVYINRDVPKKPKKGTPVFYTCSQHIRVKIRLIFVFVMH